MNRSRWMLLGAGLGCWYSVAFAYFFLEKTLYMNPCPLCMMQRLAFGLIGLFFIADALWWPQSAIGRWAMRTLKFASVFFGIALAARHIYIQNLPAGQQPTCGLDFYGMMDRYPLFSGLWRAMQGTGECAVRDTFWGLTIPSWSMGLFVVLLFVAIFTEPRRRPSV